jgi:hypothetical protein
LTFRGRTGYWIKAECRVLAGRVLTRASKAEMHEYPSRLITRVYSICASCLSSNTRPHERIIEVRAISAPPRSAGHAHRPLGDERIRHPTSGATHLCPDVPDACRRFCSATPVAAALRGTLSRSCLHPYRMRLRGPCGAGAMASPLSVPALSEMVRTYRTTAAPARGAAGGNRFVR